jgi:hypothetical protein
MIIQFRTVPIMIPIRPMKPYQVYSQNNDSPKLKKNQYDTSVSNLSIISEEFRRNSEKNLLIRPPPEVMSTEEIKILNRINKLLEKEHVETNSNRSDNLSICKECVDNRKNHEENQQNFFRLMRRLNANIERNELRLYDLEIRELIKNEWRQLAMIIDRLMLYIFTVFTSVVLLSIYYQRPED